MAQPRDYTRQYNFNDFQATNPDDPLPGNQIDAELNTVKLTLDDLNANIAKIQRDDGKLGNASVHKDAFDQAALALINSDFTPRGDWVAAREYAVNDAVDFNGSTYVATVAHTSSAAFATDDAADRWILIANAAISGTGSAVDKFEGDGNTTQFTLSYNYTTETAIQVFVNGELLNPVDDYTISNNVLTLYTAPGLPVVAGNENVIVWGASVVAQAAAQDAQGHESNASGYADEAEAWASKTNGIVESTDYSSKAWATGGTGVDGGDGSAKDWAIKTTGTVGNTTEYSSKYWATQGDVPIVASNIADINTVAAQITPTNNVATLAGINADITTVSGISADVTTVGGISADVSTAASISSDISTVASDSSQIQSLAAITSSIVLLGTADAVSDMNALATSPIITDMDALANLTAEIDALGDITSAITTVSGISSDVSVVSGISANVTSVAGISANISTVASYTNEIDTIGDDLTSGNFIAGSQYDFGSITDAASGTSGSPDGFIVTVYNNLTDIASVAGVSSSVSTLAPQASNIATLSGVAADISTAATNVTDITNFADVYIGPASSNPTTRADSTALQTGDLFFNTTSSELRVYNGSTWQGGVTASSGLLSSSNNLSDVGSAATSRTNLGLGSAATSDAADFAAASHTHTLSEITDSGTMASQDASNVNITGGIIDGGSIV